MTGHDFQNGHCKRCGERQEFCDRIGLPCLSDEAVAEKWWRDEVLSGGMKRAAHDRQFESAPVKTVKKPKKAAEPSLFDGFD